MKETILPETRFGLLTTKELTKNKEGKKAWRCLCDCGNEKIVRDTDLKLGKVKTCGYQCPLRYTISGRVIDETGKVYGRLTVIKRVPPQKGDKRVFWECKCSCGNFKIIRGTHLTNGLIQSCGCLQKETIAKVAKETRTTHKQSDSRIYGIYKHIKHSCYLTTDKDYITYGKRGIIMCDDWKSNFQAFYDILQKFLYILSNPIFQNSTYDRSSFFPLRLYYCYYKLFSLLSQ